MAEIVDKVPQEFWRPPAVFEPVEAAPLSLPAQPMADVCSGCNSEFMIGAKFCHRCGLVRSARTLPSPSPTITNTSDANSMWPQIWGMAKLVKAGAADLWEQISFPEWMRYLHFHEIKRWVGLPTASLIAFIVGLGCMAGVVGVSIFYRASNLAEFQAIQLWRIEWLLGATAAFVAGILLKDSSNRD